MGIPLLEALMRRAWLATAAVVLLASCGGGGSDISGPPPAPPPPPPPPPPAPVATVTLNLTSATLVPAETRQLTATTRDAAGNTLTDRPVTWTSSAANVATVSSGLVTGVAAGAATITATSEGQRATATFTVSDGGVASANGGTIVAAGGKVSIVLPAGAVTAATPLHVAPIANPPTPALIIGGTAYEFGPDGTQFVQAVTLRVSYEASSLPQGADATLLRLHRLESNAWTPVAGSTVDVASHTVSGVTSHFSAYAVAMTQAPVATVEITPAGPFDLAVGETRSLTATAKGANGQTLDRPVTWATSSAAVATISSAGLLTGVASGTASITAMSDDISASVSVTVSEPPPASVFSSLGVGNHMCGVTPAGQALCWGRNDRGELGDGTTVRRSNPTLVKGGRTWSQITTGLQHTCALTPAGSAWCWGNNAEGELGDGSTLPRSEPVQVSGAPPLVAISAGSLHTCGITSIGDAWCWGDNRFGQLGDVSLTTRTRAVPVSDGHRFLRISAGQDRTCGVTLAHQVWCWGSNGGPDVNPVYPEDPTGILGIGVANSPMTRPAQVVGNHHWEDVSAGYRYSCGILGDGSIRCWGANTYHPDWPGRGGMLGDGSLVPRQTPVLVAVGSTTFSHVGTGFSSTCALTVSGEAWCWGTNWGGEVGDGGAAFFPESNNHVTPIKVTGGLKFTKLVMDKINACGITVGGEVWCWGYNGYGQLSDGTMSNKSTPVRSVP